MTRYAAFLRGIMPSNPNMRNEKLCGVFASLGFSNVRAIISSGNVIFEAGFNGSGKAKREVLIEKELTKKLGIKSGVFLRSIDDLKKMVKKNPFKGKVHSRETYLLVTFLKKKPFKIYSSYDVAQMHTPDFMREMEKKYGKENTSRTWKTVLRVIEKMDKETGAGKKK
jgi:uncharacterized protein (DUF1697 family)